MQSWPKPIIFRKNFIAYRHYFQISGINSLWTNRRYINSISKSCCWSATSDNYFCILRRYEVKQCDVLTLIQKTINFRNVVRDGLAINDFQKKPSSKFHETVVLIKDTYRDAFLMGSENFPSLFYYIQSMLFRP